MTSQSRLSFPLKRESRGFRNVSEVMPNYPVKPDDNDGKINVVIPNEYG
ncbi:MAG: hypothetical protein CSYNP_02546 [Syntrophus sp. SKADARSKE-3]|nr:hypothetical protein [Syntrophus sp. SKADARSKE-3]